MSSPGTTITNPVTPAQNTGLINTAPGSATPTNGGALTSAQLPAATSAGATPQYTPPATAPYDAKTYDVSPNMTVAGQIKDIIASGSPLMQQAEANARGEMNRRGLINSTQAITAGQDAVYAAATPIATADAQAYQKAASENTAATNTARQFNSGAVNAAGIAGLQANTTLTAQDMQNKASKAIADLQANTTLTAQDMQDKSSQIIAGMNSDLQRYLGQLSSNTSLTTQQMATEAQKAVAAANNASAQLIARIQSDTSLSIQDKQDMSSQIIAQMNNENARVVQDMVNKAALENIQANGVVNERIQQLTNDNKTLLQTSASASQIYTQMLTAMSNIQTNTDLSEGQKTTALNNQVQELNDALATLSKISNIPGMESLLNFQSSVPGAADNSTGYAAPAASTVPTYGGGSVINGNTALPAGNYGGYSVDEAGNVTT